MCQVSECDHDLNDLPKIGALAALLLLAHLYADDLTLESSFLQVFGGAQMNFHIFDHSLATRIIDFLCEMHIILPWCATTLKSCKKLHVSVLTKKKIFA